MTSQAATITSNGHASDVTVVSSNDLGYIDNKTVATLLVNLRH